MIATMMTQDPAPSKDPTAPPFITFFGPDNTSQVKAIDRSGLEVARFALDSPNKGSFNISRLVAPGTPPTPICSAQKKSSLSSRTVMNVHGQAIEFAEGLEGREATLPALGKVLLKSDGLSEKRYKMVDRDRHVLAKISLKELRMDVYIPSDEMVLDCLLASYVGFVKAKNADGSTAEWVNAGAELIGAFAGGGGGG